MVGNRTPKWKPLIGERNTTPPTPWNYRVKKHGWEYRLGRTWESACGRWRLRMIDSCKRPVIYEFGRADSSQAMCQGPLRHILIWYITERLEGRLP